MSKGWVVVRCRKNEPLETVAWFETKEEAQEEADLLNTNEEPDTWYGWERHK